jgi:hypothetical protein
MNYKDKLKESQGESISYPKITTSLNLEVKEQNGKPCFAYWDTTKEEMVYTSTPIEGVLIGKCMMASVYDDNLGSKGGTYKSSYYLTNNDKIVLFGKGGQIAARGTIDEIEAFAVNLTGNLSKKQVILVQIESGLLAVITNITLAIGGFNAFDKDVFLTHNIVITPKLYDPNNKSISEKTKKYLGKFASKNPPKYAEISIGKPIEEIIGLGESIDMFLNWKKFISAGIEIKEEIHENKFELPESESLPEKKKPEGIYQKDSEPEF